MGRARAERWIFVVSLAALMALGSWWAVAMSRAVDQSYAYQLQELKGASAELGSPDREELEAWYDRRRFMVFGEGGLLMLLTAICCLMLFRLAAEQRRFREQLEAFVGQATHELKTPLAGLRALLQTVQLGRMPDEQLTEAVGMGLRQIDRQERLIQNLLMGHRIRFAQGTFHRLSIDLKPLIEGLLRERTGVGDRGCQFALDVADDCAVLADAEALQTILENLLENAVRYGAKVIKVGLARDKERSMIVRVSDDGQGFEPSRAEEIFEPFRRATSEVRGTGLGLPLSRSLAEAMGGTLVGHSDGPGQGAQFSLTLEVA